MTDLALNGAKRAATDSAVAYPNIRSMIEDFAYDYIYGHAADKFSSGADIKAPIDFS